MPSPGQLVEIIGLPEALEMPGVIEIQVDPKPGDLLPEISNGVQRAGFVITAAATREDAIAAADAVERSIVFRT